MRGMRMSSVESDFSSAKLDFLKSIGIDHLCHVAKDDATDFGSDRLGYWDGDEVRDLVKHVSAHAMSLDMLTLPLNSQRVERSPLPNILLATSLRDAEIDRLIKCIQAAAYAGVPSVKFNFTLSGVLRTAWNTFAPTWRRGAGNESDRAVTSPEIGRGGAEYAAFRYKDFDWHPDPASVVTADETWARLQYLVDKLDPVINDLGVRISLHPHDPAVPLGVGLDDRILRDTASLERFLGMSASPLFGLTFCQGTLVSGGATTEDLVKATRAYGQQIFMVHFRNIVGGYLDFREGFVDEGDIDLPEVMKAYWDTTPEHMLIVPDHYPAIIGDSEWGHQTRAYAVGYIKGLIRSAGGET
jgi:mannonate dehydratase